MFVKRSESNKKKSWHILPTTDTSTKRMFGIIFALCQSLRIFENIGVWPSITGDTIIDRSVIRVGTAGDKM